MKQYLDYLRTLLAQGVHKEDRTGVGALSLFGYQMRFDLNEGFPLLTTKKLYFKGIFYELNWFLHGETNIAYLQKNEVNIWNQWADEEGNLGPIYGKQWRAWRSADDRVIDQISQVLEEIRSNPDSRRLIVSAWNVGELDQMALPPCHLLFQFYVAEGKLSCQLYQRSADSFIGVPFNIASYSLLTCMMAQQTNLQPGEFIWTGGDCHIYLNHIDQVKLQLERTPYPLPELSFKRKPPTLFDYEYEDLEIKNYQAHPHIKGEVAV